MEFSGLDSTPLLKSSEQGLQSDREPQTFWEKLKTLFCCSKRQPNRGWKHRWQRLKRLFKRKATDSDHVFHTLLKMYSGEDALDMLPSCQVSPIENSPRDDLEFFAPQLINYILFSRHDHAPELVEFILAKAEEDYQFSHKLWWVLNSHDAEGGFVHELRRKVQKASYWS
jgi:hypothetical protein